MDFFKKTIIKIFSPFGEFFSRTTWKGAKALLNGGVYYKLTEKDHDLLRTKLAEGHFIILVGGHPSLSTFLISLGTFFTTWRWPKYTHVLMNLDAEDSPDAWQKFKLVEAVGIYGVRYGSFMEVFDCDRVALLRPKGFTNESWEAALNEAKSNVGKGYDSLFDLVDDSKMSCVELVRTSLMKGDPSYTKDFSDFEKSIAEKDTLAPEMFMDFEDEFEVELEIDRT